MLLGLACLFDINKVYLPTYLLRRRRRRAYAPTSNTASHDNHEKILHGFPFLSRDDYGAPLGGPSGHRSSAINATFNSVMVMFTIYDTCRSVIKNVSFLRLL